MYRTGKARLLQNQLKSIVDTIFKYNGGISNPYSIKAIVEFMDSNGLLDVDECLKFIYDN